MSQTLTLRKLAALFSIILFASCFNRSHAQTAISATGVAPDASAMFEVIATDKGMLVPRIALTQTTLSTPVTSPLTSLLVYNTAAVNDVTPGYYYWNGTTWQRLINGNGSFPTGTGTPNYLARWITGSTLGIGVTYDNGTNVGINTTIPGARLHVSAGDGSLGLFGPNASWGGKLYVGASPNQAVAATAQVISTDGNLHLDPAPSKNMYLGYYQARDIYINPNGANVGIGNAGPGAKLHVTGGGQILGTNGTSSNTRTLTILEDGDAQINFGSYPGAWSPALQIQDNTTSRYVWLSALDNASGSNARLVTGGSGFDMYPGNTYTATFATSGNMGIGVTGPADKLEVAGNIRAPFIYDRDNTAYYVDPNGTSEMNIFTRGTLARSSLNALQDNSPVTTRAAQGDNYRNGSMGWGTTDFNTMTNWGSGFIDTWSNPGNAPGGSSHYTGIQSMHHTSLNGTNFYGWQMVTAGEANNRFFLRSSWNVPRPWVEMVHSGNYTSFGDNLGNHTATTTLNMNYNTINHTADIIADNNYGQGLVGVYSSTRYQNVFAMGTSWRLPADGSTTGNLYGLAWSHPNAGGVAGNLNTHGLLVMENGGFLAAVSGSIRARDDMRAPIFYDSNNTGYYVDPNSVTNINDLRFQYAPCIGGYCPPNYAIRLTPNLHLNSNSGYAVIVNWDNGGYQGGAQVFRVGRGDGNDNFYVCGDGTTYMSLYGSGQVYVGWNWAYQYGYSCSYSCGWWNYSTCYTTCYDYYNKMQVNGRAYAYSWANFSDGRLKKNVGTIDNALSMVTAMRGVTYDWKTDTGTREDVIKNADPEFVPLEDIKAAGLRSRVGFIAQEIQAVLPSAVSEIEEKDASGKVIGTTLGVDYITVIPVLVEAIKEQQKQIDELKLLLGVSTSSSAVQQTNYNQPPAGGVATMSAGKSTSNNLSPKEAIKILEDNLKFMTKEHQEQMREFINEIRNSDKLTPDQLSKVLEFRNNIQEFQQNQQK